jgi:hypothetical protein
MCVENGHIRDSVRDATCISDSRSVVISNGRCQTPRSNITITAATIRACRSLSWPPYALPSVSAGGYPHSDRRYRGSARGDTVNTCRPFQFLWSCTNRCELLCFKRIQLCTGLYRVQSQEYFRFSYKYKGWGITLLFILCLFHTLYIHTFQQVLSVGIHSPSRFSKGSSFTYKIL